MIWVSWRRQRTEALIAAGVLLALAAFLVPTGLHMASAYHHDGLSGCLGQGARASCDEAIHSFTNRFSSLNNLIAWTTLLPGLLGVLLAAPFMLEFEHGTHRLAWTQSITRGRWIAGKLGLAVAGALFAALVLTLLLTWWHAPLVRLNGRMDNGVYDSEGIVIFGYTLFALGLATAVGAVWRRGVPAIVAGFAAYFAVRLFVDTWLRQRLMPPLTATWHLMVPDPRALRHALVLDEYPADAHGHHVLIPANECGAGRALKRTPGLGDCFARHGYFMHAVYEPASRFWALQGIETALFAAGGGILLAFAAWWTYRRV
jgi:hypothetical protein